jgi:geranylgeranyl pyrophosphate synthase
VQPSPPDPLACIPQIERFLDAYTSAADLPASLHEAIRYALLGGGKRLRPVLAWHSCIAAGGTGKDSLPAGAAVELIHAFSLVHDDLPAMDDDDLRRGRPTLHIHAGEAMAILAGDAMMALAFELLVEQVRPPALGAELVRELSVATTGMIAGQVYDTLGVATPASDPRAHLEHIHRNKTGALIRAACRMGALSAPSAHSHNTLTQITSFADNIGLMFQVVDDLIDVETTPEQSGKRTRKDAIAGKLTYPSLLGIEGTIAEIDRLQHAALDALQPLGPAADALRALCRHMASRRK